MEREEYHRQLDKMRGQLDEMRGRLEQVFGKEPTGYARELRGKGKGVLAEMRGRAEELGETATERPAWTLGVGSLGLLSLMGILALAVFAPRTFRRITGRFFETLGF
ncbi:MAG: hypothetical protein HYX94_01845 [Chloroflexi bacterium]|nr:hypothetical protein [Chloroflexota bacterium]